MFEKIKYLKDLMYYLEEHTTANKDSLYLYSEIEKTLKELSKDAKKDR